MSLYTLVDLFAGTGAFSLAFEGTGKVHTVMANDMEPNSKAVYEQNFPDVKFVLGDINRLDIDSIPAMDILTGGFPCQPFSVAGYRKGFDDDRANVFWTIMRIVDHRQPACIILENVKNLVTHDNGNTFQVIQSELEKRGYTVKTQVLNTCKVTEVPQNRERIYLVCFKNSDTANRFRFPDTIPNDHKKHIRDLLTHEEDISDKYYYKPTLKVWDIVSAGVTKNVYEDNAIYQLRRQYIRENKKNVCPTLTANMGGGGHNVPLVKDRRGIRKLTPRECFQLQGFPESYKIDGLSDTALYKLAGNAVSVGVVERIARGVIDAMEDSV